MSESTATRQFRGSPIPAQLTRFVGRSRELDELEPLLRSTRLLTLTGAGGSGKTRLAAEVVGRAADQFETLAWVDLGSLVDGSLVAQQAAVALGVAERAGVELVDALLESVRGRPSLIVLDNCEHLVDACADLVDQLLRGSAELTVLATSRAALGVPGETAWLVPSLAPTEAVQLFVDRARAVLPSFSVGPTSSDAVQEICRRLDGIPLAIELAAARIRALTPEQIAERLSDAFRLLSGGSRTALPRHRTLRGTMDWSYGLLTPRERVLLRRLAVFAGSFTLDAAESICAGDSLEEDDILDGISALVDKSLVIMESAEGEARYHLLETVRQYAEERLREAGEPEPLRERHARYFLELAERAEPFLFAGAGNPVWFARIRSEVGNLRAAAIWSEEDPARIALALRMGAAIHWFWFASGQFHEARQRLAAAIERSEGAAPALRGQALISFSMVAFWQGDIGAVRGPAEEAVALLRDQGDPLWLAYAETGLGAALDFTGDPVAALPHLEQALAIVRTFPLHPIQAFSLYWKGRTALDGGDIPAARAAFEEAVRIGRALRHGPAIGHPLNMLGHLAYLEGRYEEAFFYYGEAVTLHHEALDRWGLAHGLQGTAQVAIARGWHERGVRLMAAAEEQRERIGSRLAPAEQAERDRSLAPARAALGSRFETAWARGKSLPIAEAVELACTDGSGLTAEYPIPVMETKPPLGAPSPAAGLKVLALGPLQVYRGGELVEPTAWGSARPRELLVFLLMKRTAGCTKEEVGLALWSEASPTQLRNSFHVTLHRLRKALGNPDWIEQANERYQFDPELRIEFDVELFEQETRDARLALARGDEGAALTLERALGWYRGEFLDGEPVGDWHLVHRDHLRMVFADGAMALGEYNLAIDRPAKAAEIFRRVLVRDELRESAWRGLMQSHARLGERTQAMKLYQQLCTVLDQELESGPDPETVALFERIKRSEV